MTIIYQQIESNRPQTHVFIIGVGKYPYLLGGDPNRTIDEPMGLNQLSSPPISARKFNVKTAFRKWYDRCDAHEKNMAIFYFCGHGVQRESLALLLEDFGINDFALFENSIDFDRTYQGMNRCQANSQCYFVDSCRNIPSHVLNYTTLNATALIDPQIRNNRREPRDAPKLHASAYDGRAYGLSNQITRFTEALIRGFEGLGSEKIQGRWVISTHHLCSAVAKFIKQGNRQTNVPEQRCQGGGELLYDSIIHCLRDIPSVPVIISTKPFEASVCANFCIHNTTTHHCRSRQSGDWNLEIRADIYKACAYFPGEEYENSATTTLIVLPPYVEHEFEVERRHINEYS